MRLFWSGIVIVAAMVVVWAAAGSHTFHSCAGETNFGDSNGFFERLNVMGVWRHCAGVYLDENNTVITAISTAVIAWFTATIWWINRSQLRHSHEVERAYISAGGVPERRVAERFDGGTRIKILELTGRFEVHINNHGKTPGELMQIAIGFCDAENIPSEPSYEPQPFHDWIGPGTQSRVMDWRPIPTDRPASAVYGRIYYRDIFKRDQFSSFIQRILPNGDSTPLLAPSIYTASSVGRD